MDDILEVEKSANTGTADNILKNVGLDTVLGKIYETGTFNIDFQEEVYNYK